MHDGVHSLPFTNRKTKMQQAMYRRMSLALAVGVGER
jgi:hypothetical protein